VVSMEKGGVRVSGAKSVGSLAAQGDEIIFTNLTRPDFPAEACIWAALPTATDGVRMVCREAVSHPGAAKFDHPLGWRGEEADQFIIFDKVLIPEERIFNLGDPTLLKYYGPVIRWVHWHILTRLAVKAEIFIGTAQLVIDALGTEKFPGVRVMMAELIEYAQALRAFVIAAEETAELTEGGVMAPNMNFLTTGRLLSIKNYPRIIHTMQELCGQGLVMRFTEADFNNPEVGHYLDDLLPGHNVSAQLKNRLMNFVWDLTSSSLAGRTELFENVNATPAAFLCERIYAEHPRAGLKEVAGRIAGIEL
ncbi:MAG TPA: 4-hydroxyphenylacetate 3-hydroxylase C-terminal domain-containing protein, partial [Stellaceae bacterium]|nr:4-hydroxyphenylacetate 3-hydroxylase C-terminal domain-containing protein [Stellaceae bacterium]